MGSTKDPADGKAVAGSVFAAVVVYAVCCTLLEFLDGALGWENGMNKWRRSALIGPA